MRNTSILTVLLTILGMPTLACGQAASTTNAMLRTVTTAVAVHFDDGNGQDILLPAGTFYVSSDASTLNLARLEDGERFSVSATLEEHAEPVLEIIALSIPATTEQPDIHRLVLMFADGSQLVATGSYSGIQQRGLCGPACKAARDKAAAAALAAQRRAAQAAEQARQAALLAQQRAQEAAGNIADAVGGGIQELIEITTNLELKDLLVCLSNAPGDSRLGKTVAQVTSDPAAYIRGISQNLETKLSQDIPSRLQTAMQSEASNGQIIDRAISRFDAVVQSNPAAKCLMGYVNKRGVDWKAQARNAANTAITTARADAEKLFNDKIIPAVTAGLAKKMGDALDKKGFKSESVATALFVKVLTDELKSSNATFRVALASDVSSRNSADMTAAMARTTDFPETIVLKFGYELLRARGHDFVDQKTAPGGDWAADQIKDVYIAGMDSVNEVVGALCGLIPEVGGIICAPISYVTRIIYSKIVAKIIKTKLLKFMNDQLDTAMDRGWEAIEANTDPDQVWQQAGPLGIVLQGYTRQTIAKIANDEIGPFRDEFIQYNKLISALVTDYAALR